MTIPPLHGVTVLDFSTRLPGPLATLMLAQAGARVIKVERPPHGDELRAFAPRRDGMSAHFHWLNRGKESVALDLKADADRAALEEMLAGADVLVEQFRPGVMARLGLGWADLSARHPRLIYCAVTGYGQADPRSLTAAHDLNYQAAAGLVGSAAPGPDGRPGLPPVLLGDIAGGSYPAVMSILLALMQRQASGQGQFLDIAMSQNVEVFTFWNAIQGAMTGQWPEAGGGRHTGGSPRYRVYAARDGRHLAVAALELDDVKVLRQPRRPQPLSKAAREANIVLDDKGATQPIEHDGIVDVAVRERERETMSFSHSTSSTLLSHTPQHLLTLCRALDPRRQLWLRRQPRRRHRAFDILILLDGLLLLPHARLGRTSLHRRGKGLRSGGKLDSHP